MAVIGRPGDPDLHGGYVGSGTGSTPYLEGRSKSIDTLDIHGAPIRSPVPLDGEGHALDLTAPPITYRQGTWWEGLEIDFSTLPVLDAIL